MPWVSRRSSRVWARRSKAASSSNEPGTNLMLPAARAQTSSFHGVRECSCAASLASASKSPSPQSRRANPSTTKLGGSIPRLARSYTAGISFLRARSPVTPKITRAQGSGMRGSRRSCGSRSGLATLDLLGQGPGGGEEPGGARRSVGQMQMQERPPALGERLPVAGGLRRLQLTERERLPGYRQVDADRAGDLEERAELWPALVVLPGRVQESRPPPEGHRPAPAHPRKQGPDLGHIGLAEAIEIGHHSEVSARSDLAEEGAQRVLQACPRLAEDLQPFLGERGGLRWQPAGQDAPGVVLGLGDVGLVERVDPEDAPGHRGRVLPGEELRAERTVDGQVRDDTAARYRVGAQRAAGRDRQHVLL